jgi:hypothetical protein
LDVSEPVVGWVRYFEEHHVEIVEDHLGRPSVHRAVLARLIDEQRSHEARQAEEAKRAARMTAPVAVGVPAIENGTAFESLMAPDAVSPQEEFGRQPKPDFLADQLEAGRRQQAAEREAIRRRKESR